MSTASDFYDELELIIPAECSMKRRYQTLRRLLDRMLKELTLDSKVEYCGVMPRLYALCKKHKLKHQPLSVLWMVSGQVLSGQKTPSEKDFRYDLKALCMAITGFYAVAPPPRIALILPDHWREWTNQSAETMERMRMIVESWDDKSIFAYDVEDESQRLFTIDYEEEVWHLNHQLYAQAQINLLSVVTGENGHLIPTYIIVEPDYLVDITTVARCFEEHGHTATHYVMHKFLPSTTSLPIQLGNVANQLLDDIVNRTEDFRTSMQRSFSSSALTYCTLDGVDGSFFKECEQQYANLQTTVHQMFPEIDIDVDNHDIQLEPSFLSEALGLQGRFDLLTGDYSKIVELKSGKADDFNKTFQLQHAIQMALYKEILHYSLGISRERVKTLLLYSRYPKLFDIRLGHMQIAEALSIRNGIVAIERTLRSEDCLRYLLSLKEEDFCTTDKKSSFYLRFKQRAIHSFLETLRQAEPIVLKYVCRMTMFMQREQFLAKLGNEQIDTDHGFAQTWLTDVATKRELGNMITDATIHPQCDDTGTITHLQAILPLSNDDVQSNFREGDTITLYQRNSADDTIVTRQSIRCVIEEMHSGHWLLQLLHPQRNVSFLKRDNLYAIEPAHIDAGFASSYRGLFSLLTCLPDRRRLILGQRQPEYGEIAPLSVPLKDETTRTIVQNIVRARDYYLLVGPPGTGKTNVALRAIVLELLGSLHESENILLLAYTNRAVDEICEMLENLPDTPDYIRIGKELSCSPRYRNRLLDHVTSTCTSRQKLLQRLGPVRVFCGTVTTLCGTPELFILKRFHTAIIDEASQVLEPQLMPLLTRTHQLPNHTTCNAIGRFIFIGDHKQLPAVVVQPEIQSRVEDEALRQIGITDCRLSLFERLHRNLLSFQLPHLCGYLERQGRMHPDICSFVTEHYYAQHLREVPLPHQQRDLQWTLPEPCTDMERAVATHRLLAFDVLPEREEENNKANRAEAVVVADLVSALVRLHETSGRAWTPANGVGIIVPFRGQIAMIRRELEAHGVPDYQSITIDTVERYQGSQREVIIFSTVVRQNYQLQILSSPSAMAEGYWVDRKLNVAITRAREQFFLVGNHRLLRKTKDYNALLTYIASQQHR